MGLLRHWLAFRHDISLPKKTAFVFVSAVLLAGCGDVFRPVANPIPRAGGDPAAAGEAIVLGANVPNDPGGAGATTHINTSGDTVVAIEHVGVNPVHAIVVGSAVVVANHDDHTISLYPVSAGPNASVSSFNVPAPDIRPATIPQPTFLATTDNVNIYLAEQGSNVIGVIPVSTLTPGSPTCTAMQPAPCVIVDASIVAPAAIAQLPGGGEIYVANQGSNQVTVIDPATLAVKTTVPVGSSSSSIVASPDGNCVYAADGLGGSNVRVIATAGNPTKTVTKTIGVGGGPSLLRFDPKLQRVYVANSTGVSVIAHSNDCNSTSLTAAPIPGTGLALSVTALADGSRAYAALSNGNVAVIDAGSNTLRKIISGQGVTSTNVSIGSSADSTKVYVANSGDLSVVGVKGKVFVIRTSDDTVIPPPSSTFMPQGSGSNPQFILMNP
jgi:YVTN family beta-propeller protein